MEPKGREGLKAPMLTKKEYRELLDVLIQAQKGVEEHVVHGDLDPSEDPHKARLAYQYVAEREDIPVTVKVEPGGQGLMFSFGKRPVISTRDLTLLPEVETLRALLQSLAMLDAILQPVAEYRYYSFDHEGSEWGAVGALHTRSGDEFQAIFTKAGCLLKGYDGESPMAPNLSGRGAVYPGVLENVPAEFSACLDQIISAQTTFCTWRKWDDDSWNRGTIQFPPGEDPDGSQYLLKLLDGKPASYRRWAEGYYEQEIDREAVEHIYAHKPLTSEILAALHADVQLHELAADIEKIGYPAT